MIDALKLFYRALTRFEYRAAMLLLVRGLDSLPPIREGDDMNVSVMLRRPRGEFVGHPTSCWVCGGPGDNQRWQKERLVFSWCNNCGRASGGCPIDVAEGGARGA